MLSRVANLVYWMARYLERAENTARIIDVNAQLVLDLQSRQDDPRSWEPLVYVSGHEEQFFELYSKPVTERNVVDYMLFDRRNPSSVMSCIAAARENARCIRDQLASEVWEDLNTFFLQLKDDGYPRYAQIGSSEYLARLKLRTQQFYGVADSMIPRNQGWWFFELGRHLERIDNTSRILDVKYFMLLPDVSAVGSAIDLIQWASVLRSCSAFEAFRRTRRGQLNLERVVDYLVRDREFPRSILFGACSAEHALAQITAGAPDQADNAASRQAQGLCRHLEETAVAEIIRQGLHEFLDDIQVQVAAIHAAVQAEFIEHASAGGQSQRQQ
ncbi:MAG TPA: alpha-E domain-containing protein [Candidatus Synoicihabitans sp.]|nr:alpha-E domain-containing protein [Candidatus Synoicihabitans sp.]